MHVEYKFQLGSDFVFAAKELSLGKVGENL